MTDRIPLEAMTSDQLDQLYERLDAAESDLAELTSARQHGAYTFCEQLVGHVTVAEFARKISEKRTALAQREEAVRYANQQQQRAERAEAAIDRVRALHVNAYGLCDECTGSHGVLWPCRTIQALDEPTPAGT